MRVFHGSRFKITSETRWLRSKQNHDDMNKFFNSPKSNKYILRCFMFCIFFCLMAYFLNKYMLDCILSKFHKQKIFYIYRDDHLNSNRRDQQIFKSLSFYSLFAPESYTNIFENILHDITQDFYFLYSIDNSTLFWKGTWTFSFKVMTHFFYFDQKYVFCFKPQLPWQPRGQETPVQLHLAVLVHCWPHRDRPQQLCPLYILEWETVSQHDSQHHDMVDALQGSPIGLWIFAICG